MTAAALATACSNNSSNPAQPSSASAGSQTSTVVAPKPLQPGNSAQVRYVDQPVTLVIQNGVVTGGASATYTFEVATDQGFANKVQTKDGVAQSGGSQTSVKLDQLAGGTDYYWHARTVGGGTTGVFSPTYKFTVGPAIILQAPNLVSPASGATTAGWPTFTVSNVARSGPAGPISYRFDIAANTNFSPVLLSGTVAETPNVTSFTPPASTAAPTQRTLYWRVIALDQTNGVSSNSSAAWTFTYAEPTRAGRIAQQEGVALWPGAVPAGTGGHIQFGGGWDVQTVASHGGVIHTIPTIEELRVVDLLDRGMDPYSALAWMNANGYSTSAVYYPASATIGFAFEYMAYTDALGYPLPAGAAGGAWGLVQRVE